MFRPDALREKVIIVTGGGTGLGRAMALRFGELGAKLVLTSRNLAHLETTATKIRHRGAEVLTSSCDVRDPEAVASMVQSTVERFGKIDGLVNNAAGNFLCPTEDLSPNGFNAVVQIVLYGTFHCTQAVGRQLIRQGTGGAILNITTTYAETGSAFVVPSAAAKAGVTAMTRSLAVEWARHRIRSNAIAPGPFPTEGAWSRLVPKDLPGGLGEDRIPLGRYGRQEELADLASFLMSDGAGYITGQCVAIDGGESLMAGQFNAFTRFDPEMVRSMMSAMRPAKT